MTREQAKAILPIIQSFSEGKTIQWFRPDNDEWIDIEGGDNINLRDLEHDVSYRVKPESKYRPFKNVEECWQEMLKHQPFGWVESLKTEAKYEIQCLKKSGSGRIYSYDDIFFRNFEEFFEDYKFADGAPFGSLEED